MRFELSEIEAAAPDPAEEARAGEPSARVLRNAEGLRIAAAGPWPRSTAPTRTAAAPAARSARPTSGLAAVDGVDAELDALAERLRAAALELDDLGGDLRSYLDADRGRARPPGGGRGAARRRSTG